jgi:hypothetical protein
MKAAIDVSTRVSRELSTLMEKIASDPNREEPATLAKVRIAVLNRTNAADRHDRSLHPQLTVSMLAEIDGLVEEFGGEALAIDFVCAKASESLSRIIEAAIGERSFRRAPSLSAVRDAMTAGLAARLAGDGSIDGDDEQALIDEIDGLIECHGDEALAEEFVRFE